MRPLRYSINVTLDGCCNHRAGIADEDLHRHAMENIAQADALLFGRVTYKMMEAAWRLATRTMAMPEWTEPFAQDNRHGKEVRRVEHPGPGRLERRARARRSPGAVQQLKQQPGKGLFTGGVTLPLALAELGLIGSSTSSWSTQVTGHGPTLFAGLSKWLDLKLVSRLEFGSGAVAMRYQPK